MTRDDEPDVDTRRLFDLMLEGRRPRAYSDSARYLVGPDMPVIHRRLLRRHWLTAATVAAIAAIVLAGGFAVWHNSGQDIASIATDTDRSVLPSSVGGTIECAQPVSESVDGRQAIVVGSENQAALAAHFGDRLNAIWSGQHVYVAATDITDADRSYVEAIPVQGGDIRLIDAAYSVRDLEAFAARLQTKIPDWSLPEKYRPTPRDNRVETLLGPPSTTTIPIPESVWPTGLVNAFAPYPRSDGSDRSGENIVRIQVIECTPGLVDDAVRIARDEDVPLDAILIQATHWDDQGTHK